MTPPAEISLREVYDLLIIVRDDLTAIKATDTAKRVDDHETRLRAVEKWVWGAAGIGVIGGAALGQVVPRMLG